MTRDEILDSILDKTSDFSAFIDAMEAPRFTQVADEWKIYYQDHSFNAGEIRARLSA